MAALDQVVADSMPTDKKRYVARLDREPPFVNHSQWGNTDTATYRLFGAQPLRGSAPELPAILVPEV
jgi:hypothetical protein